MKIPEFSGDGQYLDHFSVHEFTKALGTPEDDVTNTFTARLLMLLESRPLLESEVYCEIIEEIVVAYWRDYEDHKSNFMPAFLANDILRLWRTFCVNYEARTERQPDEKKAKGKLKNYKLKHSRMLTCYSAILFLLAVFRLRETVSPNDVLEMISLTPTERLEWLIAQKELTGAHDPLRQLYERYEHFLATTNASETELVRRFMDKKVGQDISPGRTNLATLSSRPSTPSATVTDFIVFLWFEGNRILVALRFARLTGTLEHSPSPKS